MSLDVIFTIFPSAMIIICIIGAIYLITHKNKGTTECSVFIHNNDDWF